MDASASMWILNISVQPYRYYPLDMIVQLNFFKYPYLYILCISMAGNSKGH
jgi:hypothetical protein